MPRLHNCRRFCTSSLKEILRAAIGCVPASEWVCGWALGGGVSVGVCVCVAVSVSGGAQL